MLYIPIHSDTLTYQNVTGNDTTFTSCSIDHLPHGSKARIEWREGKNTPFSEVVMSDSFSTQQWHYGNRIEYTEIHAWLSRDTIFINGKLKGKAFFRNYARNGNVWRQSFPFDLSGFALSSNPSDIFCGISLLGPTIMKFGTMKAIKIGIERQTIQGKNLELIHLRVSLLGILSKLWHGDYWYRRDNGMLVKSVSVDNLFSPPTISVLIGFEKK